MTQQLPVALPRHPPGAGAMGIKRLPGAVMLTLRVNEQHDACNIAPVSAIRLSVEQPQICDRAAAILKLVRTNLKQFGELADWEKAASNNASKFLEPDDF